MTDQWRYVCPDCGTVKYRRRTTKDPTYKCTNGHEFDVPYDKKENARGHRYITQT